MSTQTTEVEQVDGVLEASYIAMSTCDSCHSPCIVLFDDGDNILSVVHCDVSTLKEFMSEVQSYLYSRQQ